MSVVINTLNRRAHLERALRALHEQTYENFEVIVVNGPSSDGTTELLASLPDGPRIATCEEARLGRSRNIGVAIASGEIVAFTDDDAIPRADWLERLVEPYADPRVAAVGGPVFDSQVNAVIWDLCTCTRLGLPDTSSTPPIERYMGPGADPFAYVPGCNMSFRRHVLQDVGGFNELLTYTYDDSEICSRVVDMGYRIHVLTDALVRHDRAANAARDGSLAVRDPYPVLFCRAIFVLHCHQLIMPADGAAGAIRAAADEMVSLANHHLSDGSLTPAEHTAFLARAESAVADGTEAGHRPRPIVSFASEPTAPFRRYRHQGLSTLR